MRLFISTAVLSICLIANTLSAQLFTDSVLVAAQPDATQFTFEYLLPTGQTGINNPILAYAYENDPILVFAEGENGFRYDTIDTPDFIREVMRYDDFNGDGFADIVARRGTVYYGNADGSFTRKPTRSLDRIYAFADWSGNGLTDVFSYDAPGAGGAAGEVYFVNSVRDSMGFITNVIDPSLTIEGEGQIAFVNADTLIDFCYQAGNLSANAIICLINDGAGGFTTETTTLPLANTSLTMGDFNGDGLADAAVSSGTFGGISILYNNGGTLAGVSPQQVFDGGAQDYYMGPGGVADVDGDGDNDLIVTLKSFASATYDIGYLLNNDTSFDAPVIIGSYPGATGTRQIATQYLFKGMRVLDLNGDGAKDVLVNSSSAGITYAFFSTLPTLNVGQPTSMAKPITVYPNPVSAGTIRLNLPEDVRVRSTQVFNGTGQQVRTLPLSSGSSLAIDGLPKGVYTVIVTTDEQALYRARFIRQ